MCHDVLTAIRPLWDGMKRNKSKWTLLSSRLVSHSSWKKRINGLLDGRRVLKSRNSALFIQHDPLYFAKHRAMTDLGMQLGYRSVNLSKQRRRHGSQTKQGQLLLVPPFQEGSGLQCQSVYGKHQPYSQGDQRSHQLQGPVSC